MTNGIKVCGLRFRAGDKMTLENTSRILNMRGTGTSLFRANDGHLKPKQQIEMLNMRHPQKIRVEPIIYSNVPVSILSAKEFKRVLKENEMERLINLKPFIGILRVGIGESNFFFAACSDVYLMEPTRTLDFALDFLYKLILMSPLFYEEQKNQFFLLSLRDGFGMFNPSGEIEGYRIEEHKTQKGKKYFCVQAPNAFDETYSNITFISDIFVRHIVHSLLTLYPSEARKALQIISKSYRK